MSKNRQKTVKIVEKQREVLEKRRKVSKMSETRCK